MILTQPGNGHGGNAYLQGVGYTPPCTCMDLTRRRSVQSGKLGESVLVGTHKGKPRNEPQRIPIIKLGQLPKRQVGSASEGKRIEGSLLVYFPAWPFRGHEEAVSGEDGMLWVL